MSKRIKTTDSDIEVIESTVETVEINGFLTFKHGVDDEFIDVYASVDDGCSEEYLDSFEMNKENTFRNECINWYFNNVEVVKVLDKLGRVGE